MIYITIRTLSDTYGCHKGWICVYFVKVMGTRKQPANDSAKVPNRSTAILLFSTLVDTTWRLFVPTIGLTLIGVAADNYWDTKPWITVIGIIVGTVLAFGLILQQLKKVKSQ